MLKPLTGTIFEGSTYSGKIEVEFHTFRVCNFLTEKRKVVQEVFLPARIPRGVPGFSQVVWEFLWMRISETLSLPEKESLVFVPYWVVWPSWWEFKNLKWSEGFHLPFSTVFAFIEATKRFFAFWACLKLFLDSANWFWSSSNSFCWSSGSWDLSLASNAKTAPTSARISRGGICFLSLTVSSFLAHRQWRECNLADWNARVPSYGFG